MQLKLTAYDK